MSLKSLALVVAGGSLLYGLITGHWDTAIASLYFGEQTLLLVYFFGKRSEA